VSGERSWVELFLVGSFAEGWLGRRRVFESRFVELEVQAGRIDPEQSSGR